MNELVPYQSSAPLPADLRRTGRAISRHQSAGQVRVVKIDTEADAAMAKADAYTAATGSAMGNVVRVAQGQRALEELAPETSGRLAMLADGHALAMADILADLRRELRRR